MKEKELLAPVGNYESLLEAVHNGADAVYLGGKKFGARAFANNFTEEELIKAIHYCHLYGVKIYITVNTLIYEEEISSCINYIRFLHKLGVDAVILQDLGLIKIVRERFPNLEIHASTQMHNHNIEQLKMYEKMGIKRVVLARELSLEEINNLKTSLELEGFIHGALCICYSGQCLFSSLLLDRSGNRGACAGICRLPFEIMENEELIKTNGKYLLSPKELSTLSYFEKILNSNIYSLKIEGRMKSPYYVGFITRLYRKLIDNYQKGMPLTLEADEEKKLKILYNREFTKGYLLEEENDNLINILHPNHQGIDIGTVLEVDKEKIKIGLTDTLNQEDGIRFVNEDKGMIVNFLYNEKHLLINHAEKGSIVYVQNKIGLTKKGNVVKTIDHQLEKELSNLPEKKINITCAVIAYVGKKLSIAFSDGCFKVALQGNVIECAQNKPTSKDTIIEKISALGNTPFRLEKIEVLMDENVFINLSELKKMRRELVSQLIFKRENQLPHKFVEKTQQKKEYKEEFSEKINWNVLVRNEEQLRACLEENIDNIYVTDEKLYEKYKQLNNLYLRLPRVKTKFLEYSHEKLLITETGSLYKYAQENDVVTDYYLNVTNSYSFNFLERMNAKRITLSIEAKLKDVKKIVQNIANKSKIELFLYGYPEVMIMKYCPLKFLVNKEKNCHICQNLNKEYYLKDRNQKRYPILSEAKENHLTHLFYYKPINRLKELEEYQEMGIRNFRIELLKENFEETKNIICKIKSVKNE